MGMGEFEKRRESREHLKASNLAGNNGTTLDLGGNLLPGPGHGLNVRTGTQYCPWDQQQFPEPGLAQPRSVHVDVV